MPLRRVILLLLLAFAAPDLRSGRAAEAAAPAVAATPRYRVAVCDWMILKRQKLGAFALAQELGADGVEVDMGPLGDRPTFDSQLGDPAVRTRFLDEARARGLVICSVAMSGFYAQSFAERDDYERMVQDCLDQTAALGVRVVFLPLGVPGDLVRRPDLRPVIVARLREAGRRAAHAGIVLAIETALDAAGEAALLDEIASPAVRSCFNFANALQHGRDVSAELRALGRDRLAPLIHATNRDGRWLQDDPQVDLPAIKRTLDEIGWSGWLVVERSRDARRPTDVRHNFPANVAHLKRVFQPAPSP